MPAPSETHVQNEFVKMALAGLIKRDDQSPSIVRLQPDRSLSVWSQTVALGGGRQRIVVADGNGLLRTRPYEPIHPVGGIGPMPAGPSSTTFYTSTGVKSRVFSEFVNSTAAAATYTCTKTNSAVAAQVALATPCPQGVGIRVGPYDLEAGGTIEGFSTPANSVHIHVIVDQYGDPGDTP